MHIDFSYLLCSFPLIGIGKKKSEKILNFLRKLYTKFPIKATTSPDSINNETSLNLSRGDDLARTLIFLPLVLEASKNHLFM